MAILTYLTTTHFDFGAVKLLSAELKRLGITRPASLSDEASGWAVGDDAPGRCPAEAISLPAIDIDALARRVPAVAEQARPTK